jgi:hypothetical protein
VSELAALTKQLAVYDDASADAGPESEHDHRPGAAARAHAMLGQGRAVAVVLERDRPSEPLHQWLAEGYVLQRDVHGAVDAARLLVDPRGQAESHGRDRVVEQLLGRDRDFLDQPILRIELCGAFAAMLDPA